MYDYCYYGKCQFYKLQKKKKKRVKKKKRKRENLIVKITYNTDTDKICNLDIKNKATYRYKFHFV